MKIDRMSDISRLAPTTIQSSKTYINLSLKTEKPVSTGKQNDFNQRALINATQQVQIQKKKDNIVYIYLLKTGSLYNTIQGI